jgi:hypothetical protein
MEYQSRAKYCRMQKIRVKKLMFKAKAETKVMTTQPKNIQVAIRRVESNMRLIWEAKPSKKPVAIREMMFPIE